ncbi:hypothetical protein BKA69DRAFT_1048424 [Paraphysoderma sedebokerense]|nr:hypothetical protein BKA69DRAFT_1048424 [Paraphysoderma sedebokerense]
MKLKLVQLALLVISSEACQSRIIMELSSGICYFSEYDYTKISSYLLISFLAEAYCKVYYGKRYFCASEIHKPRMPRKLIIDRCDSSLIHATSDGVVQGYVISLK